MEEYSSLTSQMSSVEEKHKAQVAELSLTAPRIKLLPTCQATVYSVQQQPI